MSRLIRESDVQDMLDDAQCISDGEYSYVCTEDIKLSKLPTVDAVPWEFLERYAYWFCAPVSFPQFIQDAKAFYRSTLAAMDGGFIIADGERKDDGN